MQGLSFLDARYVLTRSGVDPDLFADLHEGRDHYDKSCFEGGGFVLVGCGCALDFGGGVGDGEIDGIGERYDDGFSLEHADLKPCVGVEVFRSFAEGIAVEGNLVV